MYLINYGKFESVELGYCDIAIKIAPSKLKWCFGAQSDKEPFLCHIRQTLGFWDDTNVSLYLILNCFLSCLFLE